MTKTAIGVDGIERVLEYKTNTLFTKKALDPDAVRYKIMIVPELVHSLEGHYVDLICTDYKIEGWLVYDEEGIVYQLSIYDKRHPYHFKHQQYQCEKSRSLSEYLNKKREEKEKCFPQSI